MNFIHDKKVDNISRLNEPHGKINPYKQTKNINSHYSPILHGCMNTRMGIVKYIMFVYYFRVDLAPRL